MGMYQTTTEYRRNAIQMKKSLFPEREKVRHYRELLMHMRSQYSDVLKDESSLRQNQDVVEVYNIIASMIDVEMSSSSSSSL
jgi:hypothetical protein